MSRMQRVRSFLEGVMILLCALVLILTHDNVGYYIIVLIVCVTLLLSGFHYLIYYFTMARHMVGGKSILVRGILALDLGLFAMAIEDFPPIYILLYLLVGYLFSGAVDVMHSLEAKRMGSPSWKLNIAFGIANILIAVLCLFCLRYPDILVYIYAGGLVYTACLRFVSSFRKTAIAYIP